MKSGAIFSILGKAIRHSDDLERIILEVIFTRRLLRLSAHQGACAEQSDHANETREPAVFHYLAASFPYVLPNISIPRFSADMTW